MAQSGCAFTCHVKCFTSSLGFQLSCLCSCCRNFDKRDETVVYFYVISNSNRSKNLDSKNREILNIFYITCKKKPKSRADFFKRLYGLKNTALHQATWFPCLVYNAITFFVTLLRRNFVWVSLFAQRALLFSFVFPHGDHINLAPSSPWLCKSIFRSDYNYENHV